MPSTPTTTRMFFCRVTAKYDENHISSIPRYIKTKHYVHYFTEFYYVHESGLKTEKPHYHLLIMCKTTKSEIQKYIKYNWNIINYEDDNTKAGNAMFAVTDKYEIESKDMSLAYMLKGGINKIFECKRITPEWSLCPIDDVNFPHYINSPKYKELIEIYKKHLCKKISKEKTKFQEYYDLIQYRLKAHGHRHKSCYVSLLKFIYHSLLMDEIAKCRCIKRYNLWDWTFTLTLHFVEYKEQVKLIEKTINDQLKKNLDILD